ncbi:MAG: hypothetical protein CMQ07_03525 [Gammaproteobacteria bacterium]|nr:hypothetical protein [Gammaproteobacteria bacterium]
MHANPQHSARFSPKGRTRNHCLLALVGIVAVACGSHQAPVSEQGRRLERSAPIVLSSTGRSDSSRIQTSQPDQVLSIESRPQIVSSRSASASTVTSAPSPAATVTRAASQQTQSLVRRPVGSASSPVTSVARSSIASAASRVSSAAASAVTAPLAHMVTAGDTLFSIAFQHDLDFRALAAANGLTPPYTIFVGQELELGAALAETAIDAVGNGIRSGIRSQAGSSESGSVNRQPIPAPVPTEPDWTWPHSGRVLSSFKSDITKGIDIAGNVGDPVLAAAAGDVVYSGRGVQGTGNLIIIRHTDQFLSAYAHNSAMLVPEGMHVFAGEKIAEVGVNPAGTAMLHFEIRQEGEPIDPTLFLPVR